MGKILTAGGSFAVGDQNVPPHISRNDPNAYIPRLKRIDRKYVVLWDVETNRGWLINGTSALLHLVRTWLVHSDKDAFKDAFKFDLSSFEILSQRKPDSAPSVLIKDHNREKVIYNGRTELSLEEEAKHTGTSNDLSETWQDGTELSKALKKKKGCFLFENLVEQYCSTLEQVMENHRRVMGKNGVNVKARARRYIEGWDFAELAKDEELQPRFAKLGAGGWGWVDFIRSIEAITLFGHGFGDIIRPKEFAGMCPRWKSLPADNYYLATSVYDLNNIMEKFGNKRRDPPEPVHDLLWHSPGSIVEACRCQKQSRYGAWQTIKDTFSSSHHDPVQFFCPKGSRRIMRIRAPGRLHPEGAVVFGHNIQLAVHWKDDGKEDLEDGKLIMQSSSSGYPTTIAPLVSSLERPDHRDSSPVDSESQDRESLMGTMLRSSILGSSSQTTPNETLIDSAQSPNPTESTAANNVSIVNQQTTADGSSRRTLRRVVRRLGDRGR